MLNLYHLIRNNEHKVGLAFYTDVSFSKRFLSNQINKKTTLLYLLFFKIFKLMPKYPNFCFSFNSFSQVTKKIRLHSLFIKFNGIYCFSQVIYLYCLDYNFISAFFLRVLKVNILFIIFNIFKMINFKIFEFS